MKQILLISFILLITANGYSQYLYETVADQKMLKEKVEMYTTMEAIGFIMSATGVVLTITGIVNIASADWETHSSTGSVSKTTNDTKGMVGVILTVIGIPVTIGGTIIGVKSAWKRKIYKSNIVFNGIQYQYIDNTSKLAVNFKFIKQNKF